LLELKQQPALNPAGFPLTVAPSHRQLLKSREITDKQFKLKMAPLHERLISNFAYIFQWRNTTEASSIRDQYKQAYQENIEVLIDQLFEVLGENNEDQKVRSTLLDIIKGDPQVGR
jgi:hypothetical protein